MVLRSESYEEEKNSRISIAESFGEGQFWEHRTAECHQPFQSEKAHRQHFRHAHAGYTQEGWKALGRYLNQIWSQIAGGTSGMSENGE
jgi:hypothetical protein